MDISALKTILRSVVGNLKDHCTNTGMPDFCRELGLPIPDEGGSKRDRMHAAFDALDSTSIPAFARTLLTKRMLQPAVRNQVQDLLWNDEPEIEVPRRHRREIARALQRLEGGLKSEVQHLAIR